MDADGSLKKMRAGVDMPEPRSSEAMHTSRKQWTCNEQLLPAIYVAPVVLACAIVRWRVVVTRNRGGALQWISGPHYFSRSTEDKEDAADGIIQREKLLSDGPQGHCMNQPCSNGLVLLTQPWFRGFADRSLKRFRADVCVFWLSIEVVTPGAPCAATKEALEVSQFGTLQVRCT